MHRVRVWRQLSYGQAEKQAFLRKDDLSRNDRQPKQPPPCLRVTTKAFGIGRRVPIAQRYVER